ncbi:MAG: GTPase ObgE [Proteobacteria bacterium]|nr:GTPase ObgE [Pseudomonadota bacterium]
MKFVDTAKVNCFSGKGGAGCASMRREKYVEFGGPNGGDGGKGGDVLLVGDSKLTSLQDLRIHPHQKAKNGSPGLGDQKNGRKGIDKSIRVPLGTLIYNDDNEELLFEVLDESSHILLKGGKGGLGNTHFKTATNRAPRYAQPGEPGIEMRVRLELKIIADVGLVGFPNAGKSTFISVISNARPKIADYPFTTLVPNLGVVAMSEYNTFVVADIPGIIKDAHLGVGLGDQFLKHIQRTSVLAFLIDGSVDQQTPLEVFSTLMNELKVFSPELREKKRLILLTKIDALHSKFEIEEIVQDFKEIGEKVIPISSATGNGLDRVKYLLSKMVNNGKES